jgi:DNA-binding GntR family transcriptional regulator
VTATPDDGEERPLDLNRFLTAAPRRGEATDIVTDALREAIISGFLPPGSWLREGDIARDLGVSRTPVREAFRRLVDEELAVRAAYHGTMVAPISFEGVQALYAVRIPLEGMVARFAAERRTDELMTELRQIHEELKRAATNHEVEAMVEANRAFHQALSRATGNPYIQRFMLQIENAVRRLPSTTFSSPKRQRSVITEHEAIIRAIDLEDGDKAEAAAVSHMTKASEVRLKLL